MPRSNPFAMLFGGEESDGPRGPTNQFGNLPFATYRTICVRLCDGYYFPVSFSTLPNHFQRDAQHVPVAVRRPGRAVLPPEPRRRRRAGGVGQRPATLHQPEVGVPLPQGVRARVARAKQAEYKQSTDKKADLQPGPSAPNVRLGASKQ